MAASSKNICPYCSSDMVARIIYGTHPHTREFERDLDAGRVILGAGKPNEKSPRFQCQECGIEWAAYPTRETE